MRIELKKIQHARNMSEETNAFTADVYVDGKLTAYAKNNGHGGETDVHIAGKATATEYIIDDATKQRFTDALAWAKSIGEHKWDGIDTIIDDLVQEDLWWKDHLNSKRTGIEYMVGNQTWTCNLQRKATDGDINRIKNSAGWKPDFVMLTGLDKPEFIQAVKKSIASGSPV